MSMKEREYLGIQNDNGTLYALYRVGNTINRCRIK